MVLFGSCRSDTVSPGLMQELITNPRAVWPDRMAEEPASVLATYIAIVVLWSSALPGAFATLSLAFAVLASFDIG